MNNYSKTKGIADRQLVDFIFNDLNDEQMKEMELRLREDEAASSNAIELALLAVEQNLSKGDILNVLKAAQNIRYK